MNLIKYITIFIFIAACLMAQTEFIVNSAEEGNQRDPQIARDSDGNYVVVWKSEELDKGDIKGQLFNVNDEKVGEEFLVNQVIEAEQERPKVAMNLNGDFVVVWASNNGEESIFDVKARLYRKDQTAGDEIFVNTFTEGSQTKPSVDISEDGSFIVVWESWFQDGSDKGVYGQKFDSNSAFVGDEFLINTTTEYSQCRPVVKYFPNGNFIVLWESWKQDTPVENGYGIIAKIFSANGEVIKDEFAVNTYTNDYQWFGDIAVNADNSFVITWCSWEQDGYDGGIYLQRFSDKAEKIGSEILVNQNTEFYQWLPKITLLKSGEYAVVWSSWQQDGSREGVYYRFFDSEFKNSSFEKKMNDFTDGYQWEPSIIAAEENEVLIVWSSWNQTGNKYEVVAKRGKPEYPQGKIEDKTIKHEQGRTTSFIEIKIADSTAVTGDTYEVSFSKENSQWYASIKNANTGETKVEKFKLSLSPQALNRTQIFDGILVEFKIESELKLDTDKTFFKTSSNTNLSLTVGKSAGQNVVAPVNMALIWGSTDTLADGKYANPLYQAYNGAGELVVDCPFKVWNLDDDEPVDLFIQEKTNNSSWDIDESINIITPAKYQASFPNFHAVISAVLAEGNAVLPTSGDTLFIYTKRPISTEDVFVFSTEISNIVTSVHNIKTGIEKFSLKQNYPNPFNPSTTIEYSVPYEGKVTIQIYNMLGEVVYTLVDNLMKKGTYKKVFNASGFASGVYFYRFEFQNNFISRKMIVLK